jgi:hypothetical protein
MDLELRCSSFLRNSSRRARSLARDAMMFNSDSIRYCGTHKCEERPKNRPVDEESNRGLLTLPMYYPCTTHVLPM